MIGKCATWQEVCAAALLESDEGKVLGRVGCAIDALQRRYAEWADRPGSPEELRNILSTINQLDCAISETIWAED